MTNSVSRRNLISLVLALVILAVTSSVNAGEQEGKSRAWRMVLIGDTQGCTMNDRGTEMLCDVTRWISKNKNKENIKAVLHVGDITENNRHKQWGNAKKFLSVLDGSVPYVLAIGNHDMGNNGGTSSRDTFFNQYFTISDNPKNKEIFGGSFEKGKLENAYYLLKVGSEKFLILSLEFGPRDTVLEWANQVAAKHRNHKVILITHEFIDERSAFSSPAGLPERSNDTTAGNAKKYTIGKSKEGANNGQDIWKKLVLKHKNFILVANGHYLDWDRSDDGKVVKRRSIAVGHRSDKVPGGPTVHQLLFNPQWIPGGGDGWIQILEFDPKIRSMHVKTFSPYLEKEGKECTKTGKDFDFTLELD